MINNQISIIGLGKVGITLASSLAQAGAKVIGFDISERLTNEIEAKQYRTDEPKVQTLINSNLNKNLFITNDIDTAVMNSNISFVIVPSPSNSIGGFSNQYILSACRMIGSVLRQKKTRHTIAIVSTMVPGSSESQIIPAIEKASGLRAGDDFGYCYNPAFIALGEIVKGFCQPDFVLIGELDRESGQSVLEALRPMLLTAPPVSCMSLIEAEITKIASNTHETMRVAFANMLMQICTEVPNTDVDVVTGALSHRMGKRFFKGAAPYGGPCWPRDNIALSAFMKLFSASPTIPEAVHTSNDLVGEYIIKKIDDLCEPQTIIGILGVAYKVGTPVTEKSFAIDLAESMHKKGHKVFGWDPLISAESLSVTTKNMVCCDSIDECIELADLIVIVNPLEEIKSATWRNPDSLIVVDCWRCLPQQTRDEVKQYVGLGLNSNSKVASWVRTELGEDYLGLTK